MHYAYIWFDLIWFDIVRRVLCISLVDPYFRAKTPFIAAPKVSFYYELTDIFFIMPLDLHSKYINACVLNVNLVDTSLRIVIGIRLVLRTELLPDPDELWSFSDIWKSGVDKIQLYNNIVSYFVLYFFAWTSCFKVYFIYYVYHLPDPQIPNSSLKKAILVYILYIYIYIYIYI